MAGLLIIAHSPLASSLRTVAQHAFPEAASRLAALDVLPDMAVEEIERLALDLLAQVRDPDVLVFCDVFGATPCNVVQRLALPVSAGEVKVVTGVNVPMLWRSLCYPNESVEVMAAGAVASGNKGVMQVVSSRPQNQVNNLAAHAPPTRHDHQ